MGKVTEIENKRVEPIVITDTETGHSYTLEFSRQTVMLAEKAGFTFSVEGLTNAPLTTITELWYWAFQMHNWKMSKDKTTELLEKCGGITSDVIERLALLYQEPFNSLIVDEDDGEPKNAKVTIQL